VPASAGGPQPAPQDQQTLCDDTAGSGAAQIPERTSNTSRWSLEPVPGGASGRYPRRTGPARPAHRHRARAVRVLPVPDRRDRDGPREATQAGQRHPPAAAVLGTARGYPMPATPGET